MQDQPQPKPDKAHLTETTVSSTILHQGKILTFRVDQSRQPDGQLATREVVEHPGGVTIMPVLDDGRVILVEQWRYPLNRTLIEFPAGKLDPGEQADPLAAAQRELAEETGYQASHWEAVTSIYPAPGFCNEKLWLYKATGLTLCTEGQHTDADEFIDVILATPAEVRQMIADSRIVDAKTIALFLLAGNR